MADMLAELELVMAVGLVYDAATARASIEEDRAAGINEHRQQGGK